MLTPNQRNAAGHFRTKPDLLTISTKVEDWFEASYSDRQECLMTDHEITELVVVTDDSPQRAQDLQRCARPQQPDHLSMLGHFSQVQRVLFQSIRPLLGVRGIRLLQL